jgi:hypothetical protein
MTGACVCVFFIDLAAESNKKSKNLLQLSLKVRRRRIAEATAAAVVVVVVVLNVVPTCRRHRKISSTSIFDGSERQTFDPRFQRTSIELL